MTSRFLNREVLGGGQLPPIEVVLPTPTPTPVPADLIMTQLTSTRVYPRSTTSGGANGSGAGSVAVAISLSAASAVEYRLRDAVASGNPVLQDWTTASANAAVGDSVVTCAGVPARLGWYFLDLRAAGGPARLGTSRIAMGRVMGLAGQSQIARMIGRTAGASGTNADLGVTISPNSGVFATYADSRTVDVPAWAPPADGGSYDGTAVAELLRRQVEATGVTCGVVSHAAGGTKIADWQPGQPHHTALLDRLDAVGGFEAFYWYLGGTDAGAGTSAAAYKAGLDALFASLATHNAARGASYERYVSVAGTRLAGGDGSTATVTALRRAAKEWAVTATATYIEPRDVTLLDDVHQDQAGNIVLARHLHRAMTIGDAGPTISGGSRAGAVITLPVTHAAGATALVKAGNPSGRFGVFAAGTTSSPLALASSDPVVVTAASIRLTLAADPGATTALDVYALLHPDPSGSAAQTDMIYDDRNAEGFATGRHLTPTHTPITIAPKMARLGFVEAGASDAGNAPGWNRLGYPVNLNAGAHANRSMALLTPGGSDTGWTATVSGSHGASGQGTPTGAESGVYPDAILKWYIYNGASSGGSNGGTDIPTSTVTISGLDPAKTYNLAALGSRNAATRNSVYTVGGTSINQDNSSNTNRVATFNGISPDSAGRIVMTWERQSGQSFGYLNAVVIVEAG